MVKARKKAKGSWHHGSLKESLVGAALKLVSRKGEQGFSLREAARAVGVSVSAAYNHFPDKGGLLAAVAEDGFTRLNAALDAAVQRVGDDPSAQLKALSKAYLVFAHDNPEHFQVMFAQERTPPTAGEAALGPRPLLERALDRLGAAGKLQLPKEKALQLAWSALHGAASLLIAGRLQAEPASASATIVEGLLGALLR